LKNNKDAIPIPKTAPKLALVVWEDASEIHDGQVWVDATQVSEYKPCMFWQVGFIIRDFPQGIHITEAWNPSLVANGTQIPRGMIRSIRYLS